MKSEDRKVDAELRRLENAEDKPKQWNDRQEGEEKEEEELLMHKKAERKRKNEERALARAEEQCRREDAREFERQLEGDRLRNK